MGTHPIFESDFDCLTEIGMFRKREPREEWEARAQILPGETFATAFQRVKAENKAIEDKERLEIEKWTKEVEKTIVIVKQNQAVLKEKQKKFMEDLNKSKAKPKRKKYFFEDHWDEFQAQK